MFKIMIVACLGLLLFGCASVEQPTASVKCSGENWQALGMQTAKKLKSVRSFDEYINACGSNLDPKAKAAFLDGYARALVDVCTFNGGFELGSSNQKYPEICPLEIRADFQKGYLDGKRHYDETMKKLNGMSDELEEEERTKRAREQIRPSSD
jgi:Protein of unknown function (DUF2799)